MRVELKIWEKPSKIYKRYMLFELFSIKKNPKSYGVDYERIKIKMNDGSECI